MSDADQSTQTRPPAVIETEIEATRNRLADTIDQLTFRANPKNIVRREIAGIKAHFVDASGSPRTENILKVAGGVVAVVAVLVIIRKAAS